MPGSGQLTQLRNVPCGSEFYHSQALMIRLPNGVTQNGNPMNAFVLSGPGRGKLVFIEMYIQVSVPEKVLAFKRLVL